MKLSDRFEALEERVSALERARLGQPDFRTCAHRYIQQTKRGIPSLLPFVCVYCGMGSWYPTVEEERKHEKEFMDKLKRG